MSTTDFKRFRMSVFAMVIFVASSGRCNKSPISPIAEEKLPQQLVFFADDTSLGSPGIYSTFLDGSEVQPLAIQGDTVDLPDLFGSKRALTGHDLFNPQWNPNHSKIVCQVSTAIDAPDLMMIMNKDGSDKRVLWNGSSGAALPQWSPSGRYILFLRILGFGISGGVGIVDSTGHNEREFAAPSPVVFDGDSVWFQGVYQWGATDEVIYGLGSVNRSLPLGDGNITGTNTANEIFKLNSTTGHIEARLTWNDIDEDRFQVAASGNSLAFKRGSYGQPSTFYFLHLGDGTRSEINLPIYADSRWNWSDDEASIVVGGDVDPDPYQNQDFRIFLVRVEDSELLQLTEFVSYQPDL